MYSIWKRFMIIRSLILLIKFILFLSYFLLGVNLSYDCRKPRTDGKKIEGWEGKKIEEGFWKLKDIKRRILPQSSVISWPSFSNIATATSCHRFSAELRVKKQWNGPKASIIANNSFLADCQNLGVPLIFWNHEIYNEWI